MKTKQSGNGVDDVNEKKWEFSNAMKFISSDNSDPTTIDNLGQLPLLVIFGTTNFKSQN